MTQSFHCPNCGAPLDLPKDVSPSIRCPFCSTSVIVPAELRRAYPRDDALTSQQAMVNLPDLSEKMMEVIALVKEGKKKDAIERFREVFDTSMTVANLAIDQIESGQVVMVSDIQSFRMEADKLRGRMAAFHPRSAKRPLGRWRASSAAPDAWRC